MSTGTSLKLISVHWHIPEGNKCAVVTYKSCEGTVTSPGISNPKKHGDAAIATQVIFQCYAGVVLVMPSGFVKFLGIYIVMASWVFGSKLSMIA